MVGVRRPRRGPGCSRRHAASCAVRPWISCFLHVGPKSVWPLLLPCSLGLSPAEQWAAGPLATMWTSTVCCPSTRCQVLGSVHSGVLGGGTPRRMGSGRPSPAPGSQSCFLCLCAGSEVGGAACQGSCLGDKDADPPRGPRRPTCPSVAEAGVQLASGSGLWAWRGARLCEMR